MLIGPFGVLVEGSLSGGVNRVLGMGLLGIAGIVLAGLHLVLRDADAQVDALSGSNARLRSVLSSTADAVVVVDAEAVCTWVGGNAALLDRSDLVGRRLPDLLVARDRERLVEAIRRVCHNPGAVQRIETRSADLRDAVFEINVVGERTTGERAGAVLWWRDITSRVERLDEATRDPLTGLANRVTFVQTLGEALVEEAANAAVLFIDLDRFKAVNDTHGHHVGDAVLEAVARRMESQVRPGDLVARLGGDEFAIVCLMTNGSGGAAELASRVHRSLQEPVTVDGQAHRIGCSIGVSLRWPTDPQDGGETQLARADAAMYRAKRLGLGVVVAHPTPVKATEHAATPGRAAASQWRRGAGAR